MTEFLTRLFFEDAPLLLLAELVAMACLLAWHRRRMTRRSRWRIGIALAICAGLVAMQQWVVTDREAIEDMVRTMARAVEQGDVATLGERFEDDIAVHLPHEGSQQGKDAILAMIDAVLQRYDVQAARVSDVRTEVTGDTAVTRFQVVCDIRGIETNPYDATASQWQLQCLRRPDGWKVKDARGEVGISVFRGPGR